MLSIRNVILTKCNLYEMLPIQSVLYEMLPRQNVTDPPGPCHFKYAKKFAKF